MSEPPADGPKTITFKLHFEKPPQFSITNGDKEDMFRTFKSKLDAWNIPLETIYFVDLDGDHVGIKDAEELLGVVMIGADSYRLTVRDRADNAGKANNERKQKKEQKRNRSRNQDRSRGQHHCHSHSRRGGRSHSRDSSDEKHYQECYGHCPPYYEPPFLYRPPYMPPPMCCPCSPFHSPMDPRFGNLPFFAMGRGRGGYHSHGGMRGNFHGY